MAIEYQSYVKRRHAGTRFTKIAPSVVLKFAAMTYQICRAAVLLVLLTAATGLILAQPTLIDLQLATNLGGNGSDRGFAIAFDRFGNMWVCGDVDGPGFPFPDGVEPTPLPGNGDIFVVHIGVEEDNEGNRSYTLLQTLIIGGSAFDSCGGIVVGPGDRIFFAGRTQSQDFPALTNQLAGDADLFAAELGPGTAALNPAGRAQNVSRLGPVVVTKSVAYGPPGAEEFRDLKLAPRQQGFDLFIGGHTLAGMPLGPGVADHSPLGKRDLIILRIDEDLNLVRGVGFGGVEDEFFGDLSVEGGEGRFVAGTGSPQFEGLDNPAPVTAGVSGRFDLTSLQTNLKLHAAPDGMAHLILQKHARASAASETDAPAETLLAYGTASDAELRPTAVMIDLETDEIYDSEPNATARAMITDGAGSVQFGFFGGMPGYGECTQAIDDSINCNPTRLQPDPGRGLFPNNMGANNAGQVAVVGQIGGLSVTPTANALQTESGGGFDAFVLDTQQSLLVALVNAAFHGGIGPGDLVTAFGQKIGPRKDSFAFSSIVNNALETVVEGVEITILREDGSEINAPVLNASFGQTTFEMPTLLRVGERISVVLQCGDLISNPFSLTLQQPGISSFLFNGNQAVVQDAVTGRIATVSNPLKPGDVGALWANSGSLREPACPGPGSLANPFGVPLHRLADEGNRSVRLRAVSVSREILFEGPALFVGSPPGQLCNSVAQVNFLLADESAWSQPAVQAALTASLV